MPGRSRNSITNNLILSETSKAPWDECSDFDEKFSLFICELYKLFDSCCPIRTKLLSNNRLSKPWVTPDITILIQTKTTYEKESNKMRFLVVFSKPTTIYSAKKLIKPMWFI